MRDFSWSDIRGSLNARFLRVLGVCFAGIILSSADQSFFSYVIPDVTREFGVGLEVIGQLLSLSFLVASLAVVLIGMAGDEFGRERVLVGIITGAALCVGGHALAPTLFALGTLRVLGFALTAGVFPIASTLVLEASPARYRGLFAGLLQIGYPLGFAVASLIAAPLLTKYGWRSIFFAGFGVALLVPVIGRFLPRQPQVPGANAFAGRGGRALARVARLFAPDLRRRTLVCLVGGFCVCFATGSTTYFLPTYLVEAHGFSPASASGIVGGSYAFGIIGYLAASFVGEFVLTRRDVLIAWTFTGAAAIAATIWFAAGKWALLAGLGLSITFFYGTESVRMPLVGELYPAEIRATATSVTGALAVTLAWLVCPLAVSYLAPWLGWAAALTWCVVLPLVCGGCAFLTLVNLRSGAPVPEAMPG